MIKITHVKEQSSIFSDLKMYRLWEKIGLLGSVTAFPDGKVTWSAWPMIVCEAWCGNDSTAAWGADGIALVSMIPGSFSPLWTEFAGKELMDDVFGLAEKTKNCGRPWADGLPRCPSLLAMWCDLPMAAAAAKCWIIRSSSSGSLAPTGDWQQILKKDQIYKWINIS